MEDSGNNSTVRAIASTTAVINGANLSYEIRGDGDHPIVCIPGGLGTAQFAFEQQLSYFGRKGSGFKIVSFDPRGFGASRPAKRFEGNFYIQDALDAAALMRHLSIPNYSCLGWCGGGTAALIMAARYPSRIMRLVVWGTKAYITPNELEYLESIRDISTWNPKVRDPLYHIYGDSLQSLWTDVIATVNKITSKNDGDICKGELCSIKCPTLILHGARDPMVPCLHSEYLHSHIASSKLVVMDDGKHNLHIKHSDYFNRTVEEFLSTEMNL